MESEKTMFNCWDNPPRQSAFDIIGKSVISMKQPTTCWSLVDSENSCHDGSSSLRMFPGSWIIHIQFFDGSWQAWPTLNHLIDHLVNKQVLYIDRLRTPAMPPRWKDQGKGCIWAQARARARRGKVLSTSRPVNRCKKLIKSQGKKRVKTLQKPMFFKRCVHKTL